MDGSGTPARRCKKCGGTVEQKRMGRPRLFCRFCTPRNDADRAAAREHWAAVYAKRARERNAAAREQLAMLADQREREAHVGEPGGVEGLHSGGREAFPAWRRGHPLVTPHTV